MPDAEVGRFRYRDHELAYEVHGEGPRTFVFIHGLLLDAALNRTIAQRLAARGHRVILPELLGHGRSDRPTHAYEHRLEFYAEQVLALLDHLELDEAVVGGVSLGANVTLQVAVTAPERLRAMVLEMPVLERGSVAGGVQFIPLLLALRYLGWALRPGTRLLARLPRTGLHPLDSFLNTASGDPRELAAVLHGLFAGPTAPHERLRRTIEVPALVIGHGFDRLHPMDDAKALAAELPDARLFEAYTIFEARTMPKRIVGEVAAFLDESWGPRLATARAQA